MVVNKLPENDGYSRSMAEGGKSPSVEISNPNGKVQGDGGVKTVDSTSSGEDSVIRALEAERKLLEVEEERKKLQFQLIHAQKMEAIGRLAGGVAHDFNNMLAIILCNAEMALEETSPDARQAELQEILHATERSAALTGQLLAFVRKQIVAPKVFELNEAVEGIFKMLQRLIGEHIGLEWRPGREGGQVKMSPSQIDQILVNLCVNARNAMDGRTGAILLETGGIVLDERAGVVQEDALPGDYVWLAVSDNGCGMDCETLSQVFHPFFTTKEEGRGTGLGLATVDDIVRQNKGFISVRSQVGAGTKFKIHLPRHAGRAEPRDDAGGAVPPERGLATILLAEDEPAIADVVKNLLRRRGYAVLAATTPGEAIRLAKEQSGEIDLLITDVIMPGMDGRDLHQALLAIHPGIRCLFMSGHTADLLALHGIFDAGVRFIQKPFAMTALATMVSNVLEAH